MERAREKMLLYISFAKLIQHNKQLNIITRPVCGEGRATLDEQTSYIIAAKVKWIYVVFSV